MSTNIEIYKKDLESLLKKASLLLSAIQYQCYPEAFEEKLGDKTDEYVKKLPDFHSDYQAWYSESTAVIRQLLPDRIDDFKRHYEKPKSRKELSTENYRIEDCLQGLQAKTGIGEIICSPSDAIPHFKQQIAILKSVESRFESTLFDIKQLVQADLFDSELDASRELHKHKFFRGAGAIAGVVLEKHLAQVAQNHKVSTRKKTPTINDFNELLKKEGVIDTPPWRQIQRLGDIRNLCDHNKDREPTPEEVEELISGVEKFIKTLF